MLDHKILIYAFLLGVVPALLWLWFWLREDKEEPEPAGILALCFLLGMLSVSIVLPIERFVRDTISNEQIQIIGWAFVEEVIKYLVVILIFFKSKFIKHPINWPIYFITVALGFAAMENTMFLITLLSLGQTPVGLMTGQLRFLGSTLLHAVASGIIGIAMGLSFFHNKFIKKIYLLFGLALAISLHSAFNFFIINNDGNDFLKVFAFLWVATIINLLLFEKLRRLSRIII